MTSPNLSADMAEMLLAKGYAEAPSNNKQWRIFFQSSSMSTRWFVHEGGKVRRGKSVHNSTAITQEARRMLGRYWLEKRASKAAPKISAPPARHRATKPTPAPQLQTAKDKILTLLQSPDNLRAGQGLRQDNRHPEGEGDERAHGKGVDMVHRQRQQYAIIRLHQIDGFD